MSELIPMEKITIYHKSGNEWIRYNKMASVRKSSSVLIENTGANTKEAALIRIFDFDGYKLTWDCEKRDVVVTKDTKYDIKIAPVSELRKECGENNVFEVSSVEPHLYGVELDHIKIRCV